MLQYYSCREVIQFIGTRNLGAAFRKNRRRSVSPNFPRSAKLRDAHILSGIRKVAKKLLKTHVHRRQTIFRYCCDILIRLSQIRPICEIHGVAFAKLVLCLLLRCNHGRNSGISQENIQYTSRTIFYTEYDFIFPIWYSFGYREYFKSIIELSLIVEYYQIGFCLIKILKKK